MNRVAFFLGTAVLCVFFSLHPVFSGTVIDEGKNPKYLFVLTAKSGSFDGKTLTLEGVSPATVYFSDRPQRIAGHMKTERYLKSWSQEPDSLKKDPPNAALSIFQGEKVVKIVLEIQNPKLSGDQLEFDIRVLEGECPKKFGVSSLFVDDESANPDKPWIF